MTRRKTLSDSGVGRLEARPKRYAFSDPELRGHYVRVTPKGVKTFVVASRNAAGKQIWTTIGFAEEMPIAEAREMARTVRRRVREGLSPFDAKPAPPESCADIVEKYLHRHVHATNRKLRSAHEIERCLNRYILPAWGTRDFATIRRRDIAELLDKIEDRHGPRTADYCLSIFSGLASWYEAREDHYVSPTTRKLRRLNPKDRARSRILDDDEICSLWKVTAQCGTFGAFVRFLLLTGQRREKVATLRWSDLNDRVWDIRTEQREKGNAGALALSQLALDTVSQLSKIKDNEFVFAGRGVGPLCGFSKGKRRLDGKLPSMPHWCLHDLRRTARSLLSRLGVQSHIAERVLGHKPQGVEAIYDRYAYFDEKELALAKLSAFVEDITKSPGQSKVVVLRNAG